MIGGTTGVWITKQLSNTERKGYSSRNDRTFLEKKEINLLLCFLSPVLMHHVVVRHLRHSHIIFDKEVLYLSPSFSR